jgi:hypothetical protein
MNQQKIFDIGYVPANMGAFFKQFVLEFEKTIMAGGQSSVLMFFEDGPRNGFSTTFKSVGQVSNTIFVQVTFVVNGPKVDVIMGFDSKIQDPMIGLPKGMMGMAKGMAKGVMSMALDVYETNAAQFVEAAIKKALRESQGT